MSELDGINEDLNEDILVQIQNGIYRACPALRNQSGGNYEGCPVSSYESNGRKAENP